MSNERWVGVLVLASVALSVACGGSSEAGGGEGGAATGGTVANTGGTAANTGGTVSNTGGTVSNTGGTVSNTGGTGMSSGGAACTTSADCRLFDDYCTGCDCRALSKLQPDPVCTGTPVNCFVAPCLDRSAACRAGRCVVD